MKKKPSTEAIIDDLISASCAADASPREKHVLRESLRGLVRLAKAEQMMEMRADVDKLTGAIAARAARRRAKALLLAQRLSFTAGDMQRQLEFSRG
ncbi:hypothetical protein D3870_07085 [Noviherbaspirillum cavernae]|uniref:Uncharacterized protein n=1 Tax=Noviherbaspirillum cavernae TaxID=2320862 RepID=A0A418X0F2_9BURK|nr:hypothetical protein [Noviherbaspirillum cavernae]RJG05813.1 hypothetical protein D3870_07085 [Noviherbaspirillum cavernae]